MLLKENSSPGASMRPSKALTARPILVFLSLLVVVVVVNVPITLYISFALASLISASTFWDFTFIFILKFFCSMAVFISLNNVSSSIFVPEASPSYINEPLALSKPAIDPFLGATFHFFAIFAISPLMASSILLKSKL